MYMGLTGIREHVLGQQADATKASVLGLYSHMVVLSQDVWFRCLISSSTETFLYFSFTLRSKL